MVFAFTLYILMFISTWLILHAIHINIHIHYTCYTYIYIYILYIYILQFTISRGGIKKAQEDFYANLSYSVNKMMMVDFARLRGIKLVKNILHDFVKKSLILQETWNIRKILTISNNRL